ncbi:disrupted in renal carcinoma protein 2, partial [Biomphalaria pfeifferi]
AVPAEITLHKNNFTQAPLSTLTTGQDKRELNVVPELAITERTTGTVCGHYATILYGTIIGGNSLLNAAVPIMFELGCELAYSISEGAANGVMTLLNNFGGLIFLLIFFIPNVGTMWMNWTAIGSILVFIPMILVLKDQFNRLEVDEKVTVQKSVE